MTLRAVITSSFCCIFCCGISQPRITATIESMEAGTCFIVHATSRDTLASGTLHDHRLDVFPKIGGNDSMAVPAMLLCIRNDRHASLTIPLAIEDTALHVHVDQQGQTTYSGTDMQENFSLFISKINSMAQQLYNLQTGEVSDSVQNMLGAQLEKFYLQHTSTRLHLFSALLVADIITRKFIDPGALELLNERCLHKGNFNPIDSIVCDAIHSYAKQWTGISVLEFTAKGQDGGLMSLNTVIGKRLIILDFWASWCGPCIREMPALQELYKGEDVEIIGISIDASENAWKKSLDKLQLPWINVWDEGNLIAKQYDVTSVPTKFVIDKNGIIVARNPEDLEAVLALLKN